MNCLLNIHCSHQHLCGATTLGAEFNLHKTLQEAVDFYTLFHKQSFADNTGLQTKIKPQWAIDILAKNTIQQAIIKTIGSKVFAKAKPNNTDNFEHHITKQLEQQKTLIFRAAIAPIKNVQLCGSNQKADLAELMHYIQLVRFAQAISCLYPHGVKIELIPDTMRAKRANQYPETLSTSYITSIQTLCHKLGFDMWLNISNGQEDLWQKHKTDHFIDAAKQALKTLEASNPDAFSTMLKNALIKAEKNLISINKDNWAIQIEQSAWNYITCLEAERLSSMWSLGDVFPVVFSNHPNNFQLHTLKKGGNAKLPWQISVPVTVDICQEFPLISSLFNVDNQAKQAA